jgi:hypothetical protein
MDPGGRKLWVLLAAGTLLWLAQSMHYTALYLIAPFVLVACLSSAPARFRQMRYWVELAVFVVACGWLQAVLEIVSRMTGALWKEGPLATLQRIMTLHLSPMPGAVRLRLWWEFLHGQIGWPMLIAVGAGALIWVRRREPGTLSRRMRATVLAGLGLGLLYLLTADTVPFFRQTSQLQPFFWFLAGVAIVSASEKAGRTRAVRIGWVVVLSGVVGYIPATGAYEVFQGHQGIGRALDWAYQHKKDQPVRTLRFYWYSDSSSVTSPAKLKSCPPETLVLTYFPLHFIRSYPSFSPALIDARPLVRWPTLWSTSAVHAETAGYWSEDHWQLEPQISEARVYRVGDILAQAAGRDLVVESVAADSIATQMYSITTDPRIAIRPGFPRARPGNTGLRCAWRDHPLSAGCGLSRHRPNQSQRACRSGASPMFRSNSCMKTRGASFYGMASACPRRGSLRPSGSLCRSPASA